MGRSISHKICAAPLPARAEAILGVGRGDATFLQQLLACNSVMQQQQRARQCALRDANAALHYHEKVKQNNEGVIGPVTKLP